MKRSVFLFWLYSNLTILCIPIVITMLVLFQSQNLLSSEVIRSNKALLNQVKQSLDNQFKDIKRMGLQLSLDPKVIKYVNQSEFTSSQVKIDTLDLITSLRSYAASNGDITDLYVYLKKQHFAVTTSTMNQDELLYQLLHAGNPGLTFDKWQHSVENIYFGNFLQLAENDLVYLQSLPIQNADEAPATLVVMLNAERLKAAISNIQLAQAGTVLILDSSNKPLMVAGESQHVPDIDYAQIAASEGSFSQRWGREEVTVSYVSSVENEWKYVSIVPTKIYSAKVDQLRSWIYAGLFMCIFVGGPMSVWLTRRHYMPLRRMVDMVSPKVKSNMQGIKDEFLLLQSFMSENAAFQDTANSTIRKQQNVLRSHYLARLLKGRVESGSALSQSIASFDLQFDTNRFAVLLFHIGDYEQLFNDNSLRDAESKLQYVYYIVTNITEELIGRKHKVFTTEVDGMVAFLVNIQHEDEAQAKQDLIEVAQEAQAIIQGKFYIQLTIGISDIHPTLAGIPHGFDEALEALEYKFVIGPSQIIPFDRIKRPKHELYYPLDMERQLINHIRTGQYEEAMEAVSELIVTNVSDGTLSLQLGKLLMFELIGTILKAIEPLDQGPNELAVEKHALIKQLTQCESFAEIEDEIYKFLRTVCEYVDSKKKSHNTNLKDHVLRYIDGNLADMDLSLTSLSLKFEVNAPYLSRFIKEQSGETFIDYVNKQRVELAKRLMLDTDDTITEITTKVGFSNSNMFIRVFKRYEGITPGQFRKGEHG
ncbi:helix-turn-helix domain-containing protein [Paenibacillus sp. GCM10023248]|uniref:helix-turn-helix domain-containing protein n=1 Tax=unclassified Paenibacillus TaxID=185978 RepID=UPI0023789DD3|nr:helix-turn-helix domain-containing protein [Paenibacillus sp. MAHUQ-63]MDD9266872.1 helix-turn-helix domain-containing protein [Paenibacillus sp. MAHUQ-63]